MKNSWANKIRLYGIVFVPSGLSLSLAAAIASITFSVYYFRIFLSYFEVNGSFGASNFLSGRTHNILTRVFGAHAINSAVLIMFWAAVGLIVYVIGRILAKDISELSFDVNERTKFYWPQNAKPKRLEEFFEKSLFSVAILIVLIIYCSRVLSFYLRGRVLALPLFGSSVELWLKNHVVFKDIVFVASEIVALQIVVILLRLLLKRSRVFNH